METFSHFVEAGFRKRNAIALTKENDVALCERMIVSVYRFAFMDCYLKLVLSSVRRQRHVT